MEYPRIINKELCDAGADLTLEIDLELEAFKGHFSDAPIVPGVVQLQWVLKYAKAHLDGVTDIQVERLDVLKFQNIIEPNSVVDLKIRLLNHKLEFAFTSLDKKHSSGKILIS